MVSDKQIRRLRERARKVGDKTRCLVVTKGNGSFTKRKRTDSVTQARAYPCPWDVGKHEVVVSTVGAVPHRCGWKPGGVGRGQMQGGVERQMPTALSDIRSVLKVGPSHLQGAGCGIHRAVSPSLLSVVMGWWGKKPRQDLG